ncbi:hypothetical protein DSO57_1028077 [Entomophthora muscae]|uniref:Uncharacterized protein n=1 Tax=Entomophthora muscae TaxID=34485 RepID=A0ACC2RSI9_9FUNG|nr:hypothetical protein DSO57_1028077 [Entomophthora muscae]
MALTQRPTKSSKHKQKARPEPLSSGSTRPLKPNLLVLGSIANSRSHLSNLSTGASINLCFNSSNISCWAPPQKDGVHFLPSNHSNSTHLGVSSDPSNDSS